MVKIKNNFGYSSELAKDYIANSCAYLVGLAVEKQYVYVDNKRTEDISGYQVWLATNDENPFKVKFEKQPDLSGLKIGDVVELDNLQAIKVRQNIYFKADGLTAKA